MCFNDEEIRFIESTLETLGRGKAMNCGVPSYDCDIVIQSVRVRIYNKQNDIVARVVGREAGCRYLTVHFARYMRAWIRRAIVWQGKKHLHQMSVHGSKSILFCDIDTNNSDIAYVNHNDVCFNIDLESISVSMPPDQQEILKMLSEGYTRKEISSVMNISESTLKRCVRSIKKVIQSYCRTDS